MNELIKELAENKVEIANDNLASKEIPSNILAKEKISGGCQHLMSGTSGNSNYWQNICQ